MGGGVKMGKSRTKWVRIGDAVGFHVRFAVLGTGIYEVDRVRRTARGRCVDCAF